MAYQPGRLLAFLLLISILACTPADEGSGNLGDPAFFPLQLGAVRHFRVDSIVWVATARGVQRDTVRAWVQEKLSDTLTGLNGEKRWRVERFMRPDSSQPWVLRQVFWEMATSSGWLRQEGSWELQWAVFPLQQGAQWAFAPRNAPQQSLRLGQQDIAPYPNLLAGLDFIHQPWTSPAGRNFPDCLRISLQGPRNELTLREGYAIFGRDQGLLYRTFTALDTPCTSCAQQSWSSKATRGFKIEEVRLFLP